MASPADAAQAPESKINQTALAVWEIPIYSLIVTHTHTLSLFAILLFWVFYTFNCPGPLVDGHTIGKGRTTVAKTQGKRWSWCKQRFQESAEGRKVTSELVTEEGKGGCYSGSSEAQQGPLGRRSVRCAESFREPPKEVGPCSIPHQSSSQASLVTPLTGTVSWRTHTSMGLS